jgi:predicted DNA-binding antitoxin AbrB/MazE fold protein
MVQQTVEAIFENGVFRPLYPVDEAISEGQQVQLLIRMPEIPEDILALAGDVYTGLTEAEIDEIEQIALDRQDFFNEKVN